MTESRHVSSEGPGAPREMKLDADSRWLMDREFDWPLYAVLAGVVGAFVVAVVFLAADLISGRPIMWTPAALGSALFLGEQIGSGADLVPLDRIGVVFAYTVMHGVLFVGFGALAASERLTRRHVRDRGIGPALLTAALLFVAFEFTLTVLGWLVGPNFDLGARLGSGWIAVANVLAAIAMTATIFIAARRLDDRAVEPGGDAKPGGATSGGAT